MLYELRFVSAVEITVTSVTMFNGHN